MPSNKRYRGSRGGQKVTNGKVTHEFLKERAAHYKSLGFPRAKWMIFCDVMLRAGFKVTLYEARQTFSKYVTVSDGRDQFKVRFSNHKPIKARELQGDCDFFVGVTHTGVRTTSDAIKEIEKVFGIDIRSHEAHDLV
jgi:hypothetical protein